MAFYNWKYQRHTWYSNSASVLFDDLVPSETQFAQVQNGERMILKRQDFQLPSPAFRYVIHVFEK
jgi:hypothetical protein